MLSIAFFFHLLYLQLQNFCLVLIISISLLHFSFCSYTVFPDFIELSLEGHQTSLKYIMLIFLAIHGSLILWGSLIEKIVAYLVVHGSLLFHVSCSPVHLMVPSSLPGIRA